MKAWFKALRSVKLAALLIAYLAVSASLASLLPRVLPGFFGSALFLVPVLLLYVNLLACTVYRFSRERRKKAGRRHGPDLLHLGLLVLGIGALAAQYGRVEGSVELAVGESVVLPDGRLLRLRAFEFQRYADGRPQDWISRVDLVNQGKIEKENYPIRVNHPLRLSRVKIYQAGYTPD